MRLAALLLASIASLTGLLASPVAAGPTAAAQDDDGSGVEISEVDEPVGGIIVKPNSGSPPDDPGDRGGALQLTLLALIVAAVGFGVFAVRRSVRRAQVSRAP